MPTAPCIGDTTTKEDIQDVSEIMIQPAIPAAPRFGHHRCKVLQAHWRPMIQALVARLVGRKDQKAVDVEWNMLENKKAWDCLRVVASGCRASSFC